MSIKKNFNNYFYCTNKSYLPNTKYSIFYFLHGPNIMFMCTILGKKKKLRELGNLGNYSQSARHTRSFVSMGAQWKLISVATTTKIPKTFNSLCYWKTRHKIASNFFKSFWIMRRKSKVSELGDSVSSKIFRIIKNCPEFANKLNICQAFVFIRRKSEVLGNLISATQYEITEILRKIKTILQSSNSSNPPIVSISSCGFC